jgi:ribosome-associated protein
MGAHGKITAALLGSELAFTTSRSGGPGGQNVNKVSSKVTLQFDVQNSAVLTAGEKQAIYEKLSSRMTREGVLILTAQETRSQIQNKELVLAKFEKLLNKALEKKKARKPTKPSKKSAHERIKKKKVHSEKKQLRRKPGVGE